MTPGAPLFPAAPADTLGSPSQDLRTACQSCDLPLCYSVSWIIQTWETGMLARERPSGI